MSDNPVCRPIGLFDSGVGGLSVMQAVADLLPAEDMVYVADSVHCPYGQRSPAEIRALSAGIARFLLRRGARLIVVACNTASAAALAHLRATFPDVPFVGMVPAVKPAVALSSQGVVGVLATPVTVHGQLLADVLHQFGEGSRVLTQVCGGLVEQIEAGQLATPETRALLRRCLDPLLRENIDTLVLGCTHYPFLIPLIEELAGPGLRIVAAGAAVAQQVRRVLRQRVGHTEKAAVPRYWFVTTGDGAAFDHVRQLLTPKLAGSVETARWASGNLSVVGPWGSVL